MMAEEMYESLGRMTSSFGLLEYQVRHLIFGLIGEKEVAEAIAGKWEISRQLSTCNMLLPIRVKNGELQKRFTVLVQKIFAAHDTRNGHIHAIWAYLEKDPKERGTRVARINPRTAPKWQEIDVREIREFADSLTDLWRDLATTMMDAKKHGILLQAPDISKEERAVRHLKPPRPTNGAV